MRKVNLRQLAEWVRYPSEPTIRRLIDERPDFPVLRRPDGAGRGSFLFDRDAAVAFINANWTDKRMISRSPSPKRIKP